MGDYLTKKIIVGEWEGFDHWPTVYKAFLLTIKPIYVDESERVFSVHDGFATISHKNML